MAGGVGCICIDSLQHALRKDVFFHLYLIQRDSLRIKYMVKVLSCMLRFVYTRTLSMCTLLLVKMSLISFNPNTVVPLFYNPLF